MDVENQIQIHLLNTGRAKCEEASMQSKQTYIACGAPAVALVNNGDRHAYLMCFGCADHNEKNRHATILARIEKKP